MSSESTESDAPDTSSEGADLGISDDQLPEDLQPSEDNPLAQPTDEDVPEDLLTEGSGHDHTGESSEGAPTSSGDEDAEAASREDASSE